MKFSGIDDIECIIGICVCVCVCDILVLLSHTRGSVVSRIRDLFRVTVECLMNIKHNKKSAYRNHWILWLVQIIAAIQKKLRKKCITKKFITLLKEELFFKVWWLLYTFGKLVQKICNFLSAFLLLSLRGCVRPKEYILFFVGQKLYFFFLLVLI